MNDPTITVVITVWDRYCEFLLQCLASILSQDGPELEVIVVDNASEQPLPPLSQDVRIVRSPRRITVGAARNLGLRLVKTPYVLFFDADDVMAPGSMDFLYRRLVERPNSVAAIGRFASWDAATGVQIVRDRMPRPIVFRASRLRRTFALCNLAWNTFPVAGGLYRTPIVVAMGGFGDSNVAEDWVFGAALTLRGKVAFFKRVTFLRRIHESSLWYREHQPDEVERFFALFFERISKDAALAWWGRLSLPFVRWVHMRAVRRLTGDGALHPGRPVTQEG